MSAEANVDKRQWERFQLEPMYTSVTVRHGAGLKLCETEGHAYDISASGIRFELDDALPAGTPVAIEVKLPAIDESISVSGTIVWQHDADDDPAARRMAVRFERFAGPDDRTRLYRYLGTWPRRVSA